MKRLLFVLALVAFAAAPALADPKSDVGAAMLSFGKATSYHMDVSSKGQTMSVDFAPSPNKMHMSSAQFEVIRIDDSMWVKTGGKWQKLPAIAGAQVTAGVNNALATVKSTQEDATITNLGMKVPATGGAPLHAYSVTTKSGTQATIFLDGATLIETDTTDGSSVRFSNFNAVAPIVPPN